LIEPGEEHYPPKQFITANPNGGEWAFEKNCSLSLSFRKTFKQKKELKTKTMGNGVRAKQIREQSIFQLINLSLNEHFDNDHKKRNNAVPHQVTLGQL